MGILYKPLNNVVTSPGQEATPTQDAYCTVESTLIGYEWEGTFYPSAFIPYWDCGVSGNYFQSEYPSAPYPSCQLRLLAMPSNATPVYETTETCYPAAIGQPAIPEQYYDGSEGWNAGAVSIAGRNGDFEAKITVPTNVGGVIVGINDNSLGEHYSDIDYGLLFSGGIYKVVEDGAIVWQSGNYNAGDIFYIRSIGGDLEYWVNGFNFYTSAKPIDDTTVYYIDTSLYSGGDSVTCVEFAAYSGNQIAFTGGATLAGAVTIDSNSKLALSIGGSLPWLDGSLNLDENGYLNAVVDATLAADGYNDVEKGAISFTADVSVSLTGVSAENTISMTTSLPAVDGLSSNFAYSESVATLPALESDSYEEAFDPATSSGSSAELPALISWSDGLTGEVGEVGELADAELPAIDGLSTMWASNVGPSSYEYGEAIATLPALSGLAGEYVPMDGYALIDVPTSFTIKGSLVYRDPNAFEGEIPKITLTGRFGGEAELDVPTPTLSATGSGDVVGRAYIDVPDITLSASIFSGAVSSGDIEVPVPTLTGTGFGRGAALTIPKIALSGSGTSGVVGTADLRIPRMETSSTSTEVVYGSAALEVPSLYTANEAVNLVIPTFTISSLPLAVPSATQVAYTMNTSNQAVTKYLNYNFNYMVKLDGVYYGVDDTGIYQITGKDDNGAQISAVAELPPMDFKTSYLKRLQYAYIGCRTTDVINVSTKSQEQLVGTYQTETSTETGAHVRRVKCGKGAKGHYWGVELSNNNGADLSIDTVELRAEQLRRKR